MNNSNSRSPTKVINVFKPDSLLESSRALPKGLQSNVSLFNGNKEEWEITHIFLLSFFGDNWGYFKDINPK